MSDKNINVKKDLPKKSLTDIASLIDKKMIFFQDVIQKTILQVQNNKLLGIIDTCDVNTCINTLCVLSKDIQEISDIMITTNTDNVINILQLANNELSSLFKLFGTSSFEDLLWICFGNNSINTYTTSEIDKYKFELLKKYFHPTGYKVLTAKKTDNEKQLKLSDDNVLTEKSNNLDSVDVSIKTTSFHLKVHGIQLIVHNPQQKKSLIITGTIDNIMIHLLNNKFINIKNKVIRDNVPKSIEKQCVSFNKYIEFLSLKDYLIYEYQDIYSKYVGYISNLNSLRQKTLSQLVRDFVSSDLFIKRSIITHLLINSEKYDNQYLAYLLYDLLSNDSNSTVDTQEQTTLFDSFHWSIKKYFREAMNRTIQYTNDLSNFDIQKIPLEQQICLLNVTDSVKEKAMQKLKEVKAKSEDSGSKARQYLDGLLKIPFNIYRKEPILNVMDEIRLKYINLLKINNVDVVTDTKPTSLQMLKYIKDIKEKTANCEFNIHHFKDMLLNEPRPNLVCFIFEINSIIINKKLTYKKLSHSNKSKHDLISDIFIFVDKHKDYKDITNKFSQQCLKKGTNTDVSQLNALLGPIKNIEEKYAEIYTYMTNVKTTLDNAVHGHDKAKTQIERIIGQWINGKQDGYCFGFEGPPGIGKTTIAKKGLSSCLKDDSGISRPFAMIQMGGDSNGSSLHGHNYTYVGSTWGSIVQILIDKKCMNPIIFIDEIDKISKTEHGKEIIGILTHLLDPTQNDSFQDKYFLGIDLDLSKALFILSYNDVDAIDKILLDRIHRIKFKNLSVEEKLVISDTYILPEVYEKMGLQGMITFSMDTLKFIIDEYTAESGVRKLKEILFEIVGEINLDILKNTDISYSIPIDITIEGIKTKYFKDKQQQIIRLVSDKQEIGFVNGMYATTLGTGGTLPIHAKFFPSDKFLDLKLTGLQQDVMRESMHVALTVAWNLTSVDKQTELRLLYDTTSNKCGINIHTGDGSVQKDGPSGGCAITCVIYSLLNNILIKPEFGITGEIQMSGEVTAIGGLSSKILGSIKANVKSFIFPKENEKDFNEFYEKYKDNDILKGISFYPVKHVQEAMDLIYINNL
jgi:ATP-dependent Lon protease